METSNETYLNCTVYIVDTVDGNCEQHLSLYPQDSLFPENTVQYDNENTIHAKPKKITS